MRQLKIGLGMFALMFIAAIVISSMPRAESTNEKLGASPETDKDIGPQVTNPTPDPANKKSKRSTRAKGKKHGHGSDKNDRNNGSRSSGGREGESSEKNR